MCLDNIEEIAAAVEQAKKAKAGAEAFEQRADLCAASTPYTMDDMTAVECRMVHARRIEVAEAALKDLGFRGPLAKVAPADPADSSRIMSSR